MSKTHNHWQDMFDSFVERYKSGLMSAEAFRVAMNNMGVSHEEIVEMQDEFMSNGEEEFA